MSNVMQRDPVLVPRAPGVFALVSKSLRCGYVAYTSDLQKRSHSLAHMLQNPKTHWSIAELPHAAAGEFTFTVIKQDVDPSRGDRLVASTKRSLLARKYRVIEGARPSSSLVLYPGTDERLPLTEAIKRAKCKTAYITVWRRLARGWTVAQAIELDPAPPRWDPAETAARRRRAQNGKDK